MGSELDRQDLACYGFGATFFVKTILSEPRQAHVHVSFLTPFTPKPAKLKRYVRGVWPEAFLMWSFKQDAGMLSMGHHACNASTQKVRAGGTEDQGHPCLHSEVSLGYMTSLPRRG